ncbi:MAG: hypothetical protein JXO49_10310 [Deltaproteobacteria bacterium]|nr:hypothetical protein [Candidatus Anaeroferrophillus wilburensis]MBN2889724.1 hypothetical protein [Deltaproteobacteria bacterium]
MSIPASAKFISAVDGGMPHNNIYQPSCEKSNYFLLLPFWMPFPVNIHVFFYMFYEMNNHNGSEMGVGGLRTYDNEVATIATAMRKQHMIPAAGSPHEKAIPAKAVFYSFVVPAGPGKARHS